MIVSPTLSPTATQSAAQTTALATSGSSFVAALVSASAAQPNSGTDATSNANRSFRSGRLSIDMHADGQRINGVSYFDEAGQKLTTSGFWPQDILRQCERFNIPLSDLQGLGPQLDAAGVRYKPYEQYAGTGSNHGIDLDNLASGGMGTAYDWTQDPLVSAKGPQALVQLQADQALAQRLGLTPLGTPTAQQPTVQPATTRTASTPAAASTSLDTLVALLQQLQSTLQAVPAVATAAKAAGSAVVNTTTPSVVTAAPPTPTTAAPPSVTPPSLPSGQANSYTAQLQQMQRLLQSLLNAAG